ncbi:MAG TPA: hypothetical protein VLT57_11200 [Bryobacteraceae bacterium]|nr:hypothetical protein [Bryobacteraceae bacterium]
MAEFMRLLAVTAVWIEFARSQGLSDSPALRKAWRGGVALEGGSWSVASILHFANLVLIEETASHAKEGIARHVELYRN